MIWFGFSASFMHGVSRVAGRIVASNTSTVYRLHRLRQMGAAQSAADDDGGRDSPTSLPNVAQLLGGSSEARASHDLALLMASSPSVRRITFQAYFASYYFFLWASHVKQQRRRRIVLDILARSTPTPAAAAELESLRSPAAAPPISAAARPVRGPSSLSMSHIAPASPQPTGALEPPQSCPASSSSSSPRDRLISFGSKANRFGVSPPNPERSPAKPAGGAVVAHGGPRQRAAAGVTVVAEVMTAAKTPSPPSSPVKAVVDSSASVPPPLPGSAAGRAGGAATAACGCRSPRQRTPRQSTPLLAPSQPFAGGSSSVARHTAARNPLAVAACAAAAAAVAAAALAVASAPTEPAPSSMASAWICGPVDTLLREGRLDEAIQAGWKGDADELALLNGTFPGATTHVVTISRADGQEFGLYMMQDTGAPFVDEVVVGGAAHVAGGLQEWDCISAVEGRPVFTLQATLKALSAVPMKQPTIRLQVRRLPQYAELAGIKRLTQDGGIVAAATPTTAEPPPPPPLQAASTDNKIKFRIKLYKFKMATPLSLIGITKDHS